MAQQGREVKISWKELRLTAGSETVLIRLCSDEAPRLCARLSEVVPLESTMVHAKFAGCETIMGVPFFDAPENERLDVSLGDICYYPGRQTLCLFYGETKPFGTVSVLGTAEADLEALGRIGQRVLEEGNLPVRLEGVR
jgi:hypothetical protein